MAPSLLLLVLSLLMVTPSPCGSQDPISGVHIYDPLYLTIKEHIWPALLRYSPPIVQIWFQGVIPLQLATYSKFKFYVISEDKKRLKLLRHLVQKRVFRFLVLLFFIK